MGKKDELFWIIYLLLMEYALSEDTCERGTCLGHLSFGEFLPRSAFTTKYELSPYQCATECWLRRQRCKSFNYRRTAFSCQLCEEDSGPGGINLQQKAGSIHSNINTWKNILIGHCKEINCSWTQRCDPSRPLGASACVPTECAVLELKLGMTIEPSNETAVGTKARRRCMSQTMERGDPITICLEIEAEWSSSDFICVKQNWIQDTIYPNNTHRSEVISVATNIDLLACMQQCDDETNNCLSFFYDNHTSHCVLSFSFRRGLPQGLQLSDGLVYYTAPSASCDMGYSNVSLGRSYFCIRFHDLRQTFDEAMKTCESEKAKLLVVTTQDQMTDLYYFILSKQATIRTFVGISYDASKKAWVSWKGEVIYPFFYPGQPDSTHLVDCAFVRPDVSTIIGLWDNDCSSLFSFVCHKSRL